MKTVKMKMRNKKMTNYLQIICKQVNGSCFVTSNILIMLVIKSFIGVVKFDVHLLS